MTRKLKKKIRGKGNLVDQSGIEDRVLKLQGELEQAQRRIQEALAAREHSEAKLAELEDILEFTTERADSAEVFAMEAADSAGSAQILSMQCRDLEIELERARNEAESARRILREYESLAEDAEERAYQAEHDLWLAEQRLRESQSPLLQTNLEGPLQDVVEGLVERQVLAISLDLAVKQGARHRRKVALLSVGHIGAWDVKAMQPVLAKRLGKIVRDSDMLGRLDDETFGILVSEQTELEEIRFIAHCIGRRAESVFSGPVVIKGHPHYLKVAIGVSIFPDDAPTASLVMAHSETALSEARITSQVGLSFYRERL
jgi:chromosome segregation ATPase